MVAAVVAAVFGLFTVVFVAASIKKNNGIVDSFWGIGFMLAAVTALLTTPADWAVRHLLLVTLVCIWGTRLSLHISLRNWQKPEDFRYANWRKEWGQWLLPRSLFQIFWLQAVLLLIIAQPFLYTLSRVTPSPSWLDLVGVMVWLIGLGFESVADAQLSAFKKNPANKGKIITTGLWQFSRHPNYFSEALLWWGVWLIGLNTPGAWWTIIGPLTITGLIRFVSGVPMLEKKYLGRPDWEAYATKTNAFFPWFPKK